MTEPSQTERRTRLSAQPDPSISPFTRAGSISTASVYWLPVSRFPIEFRQREWILDFISAASEELAKSGYREEIFLQLKHTRDELNKRFTQTLLEYEPVTGVLIEPGKGVPAAPTSLEIKTLVDNPDSKAEINIQHLVPDYLAWFLEKKAAAQRKDFFGVGGLMVFWFPEDKAAGSQNISACNAVATHPAFTRHNLDALLRKMASMQASWLKQSKEIFGETLQDEAMFQGLPFVLPKLDAASLTRATDETLSLWFSVFSGFCIESEKDRGLLFAVAEPEFDDMLRTLLDGVRERRGEYPA